MVSVCRILSLQLKPKSGRMRLAGWTQLVSSDSCASRSVQFDKSRVFWRRFRDPTWVPRISNRVPRIGENYHRVPKIRENRVPTDTNRVPNIFLKNTLDKSKSVCPGHTTEKAIQWPPAYLAKYVNYWRLGGCSATYVSNKNHLVRNYSPCLAEERQAACSKTVSFIVIASSALNLHDSVWAERAELKLLTRFHLLYCCSHWIAKVGQATNDDRLKTIKPVQNLISLPSSTIQQLLTLLHHLNLYFHVI